MSGYMDNPYLKDMQEHQDKFNNWLNLMGSRQRVALSVNLTTMTINHVEVINEPAIRKLDHS